MLKLLVLLKNVQSINSLKFAEDKELPRADGPTDACIIFSMMSVFMAVIFRHLCKFHHCPVPVPFGFLMCSAAILWAIAAMYFQPFLDYTNTIYVHVLQFATIYYPLMIFRGIFVIDLYAVYKSLMQILIIAIPVCFMSMVAVGFIMSAACYHWPPAVCFLFGCLATIINSTEMVRYLKETGSHTRHMRTLLEGESIIRLIVNIYIFVLIKRELSETHELNVKFGMTILTDLIVGPILGTTMGFFGVFLMRQTYNDAKCFTITILALPALAYNIGASILRTGITTVIAASFVMATERQSVPPDIMKFVLQFTKFCVHLMNIIIIALSGVLFVLYVAPWMEVEDILMICLHFVLVNLCRFVSLLIFAPILSRIGYGFSFTNMMICACGGLKSPVMLLLTLRSSKALTPTDLHSGRLFLMHFVTLYMLSLLINGTSIPLIVNALGLRQMSVAKQINMNNCVKYVLSKRDKVISVLKMERFFADANWPLLTAATELKHPYLKYMTKDGEEHIDDIIGYRAGICSDCKKKVTCEPTAKEFREMTREARLRVLKSKLVCYIRQHESGMINNNTLRTLIQAVEVAMDSENVLIELDGLHKLFKKQNPCNRMLRNVIYRQYKTEDELAKVPRRRCRRVCYKIVMNTYFDIVMYVIIVINLIQISVEIAVPPTQSYMEKIYLGMACFFCLIYAAEMVSKIYAYSWIYVWRDGVKTYFRSKWNIIDFIVLCVCCINCGVHFIDLLSDSFFLYDWGAAYFVLMYFVAIRLLKLLTYLKLCYPTMIRRLDSSIDFHKAYAYALAKAYLVGEMEILEYLPLMIDNEKIQNDMKQRMEHDKLQVTKLLAIAQKERPWVATTIKSKLAMRTILNNMKETIKDLKVSGWIDDGEYLQLMNSWKERAKFISLLPAVQPLSPKYIFCEIAWMGNEEKIIDFLFENVTTRKYDPGDTVCSEGKSSGGIFVLMTGLLKLTYKPRDSVTNNLLMKGHLPAVDFVSPHRYHDNLEDYIIPGNCFGQLSAITGRPNDCNIKADTYSQVYLLNQAIIRRAMEMSPDPINGLECRIWRSIAINIALPILMEVPAYQSKNQDEIKAALERSFLPQLSSFKVFYVTEMIVDIILIDGMVGNADTKEEYKAPCYIPRSLQRLALHKSSIQTTDPNLETRLLIIPATDVDEHDLMLNETLICEMVATSASKCLQHIIQARAEKNKKGKTRFRRFVNRANTHRSQGGFSIGSSYGSQRVSVPAEEEMSGESKR